jgi:cytochrome c oxidase accessory protein FixG
MDVPTTTATDSYYLPHAKVYPREVGGRFARLRVLAVWVLLGLYYVLPWAQLHGRQAVLFDLRARKFYIFALELWPQDFIFLTWLLILAALSLFFFTAIAGRLWCAYACPQTVWTEAFLWMERITEGDRSARMKLDAAPWSAGKMWRKGSKQFLWVTFALWTGFTFVGFFSPIRELAQSALTLSFGPWETFWSLFYGFATYGNAGLLREQVCKYMCPYARFQSAMFDQDTMIVTYDAERGEPRGARHKGAPRSATGLGDCIDCTWCVQVCPTGIDIRKGLQYECIACAACVDACDSVMDRVGYPRGLIRFTTQHALDHQTTQVVRPRVIIYGVLLTVLAAGFVVALALRKPVGLDVIRDRGALYRELDDGRVENVYTLMILNKSERPHEFVVTVSGAGALLIDPDPARYPVAGGEVVPAVVRVRRSAHQPEGAESIEFRLTAADDPRLSVTHTARFLAPHEAEHHEDR